MSPRHGYLLLVPVALFVLAVSAFAFRPVAHKLPPHPRITRHNCKQSPFDTQAFDASRASDVLYRFVYDATFRRNPARAWDYATRREQNGMSRHDWSTGNIPVVPEAVGVACTAGAKAYGPRKWMAVLKVNATFYMGVVLFGSGRWLVDYFMPVPDTRAPQG